MKGRGEIYRNTVLDTNRDRPIVADLFIQNSDANLILLCHGFKGYKDWGGFNLIAERLFEEGFHLVKFNFSHNGGTALQTIDFPDLEAFSENTYSLEQEDIRLVVRALIQHPKLMRFWTSRKLTLVGHSRGGAMATLAASRLKEVVGLVTLAAVADLESRFLAYDLDKWKEDGVVYVANTRTGQDMPLKYSYYLDFIEHRHALDVLKAASKLRIPVMVIHARDDQVVNVSEAEKLDAAIADSELCVLENGGHTFGMSQPWTESELPAPSKLLLDKLLEFLKRKIGISNSS